MFVISRFNKIYKTRKIVNAFSKACVSRTFLLCSCQAQNKVEFQNDKDNQEINKPPTLQPDSKNDLVDFIKIYRNRATFVGALVNSLKWYQTIVTICAVPVSVGLLLSGIITDETAAGIVFTNVWLSAALYIQGFMFHKTIGLIYLSKDNKTVKIAYLDFWGEKEEEEYPLECVEQFSDLPATVTSGIFKTVEFDTEKYRLYVRIVGQILDKDRFVTVFGSIE